MAIPTTMFGILALVALVVPGIVFAGVRAWLRGYKWSDQTAASRVLDAVLVSVILDALYLWAFGALLAPILNDPQGELIANPSSLGFATVVLGLAIPAGIAFAWHADMTWTKPAWGWWPSWVQIPRRRSSFESTPTAWDKVAPRHSDVWVKIRLPNGERVAGWMSGKSFVSTYPQPRDIYIQEQFTISADGSIGDRIPNTGGVWLSITDGSIVEWINEPEGDTDT
ncbi:DUF6338 family protein [Plantibacter sp. ME-Dv--P-095]|uniref:DUF6338 family protein n=1 Tax=Plantibacter sp. ME-Dv--P-095 TaxID=3040299 RepID=UPI00254BC134|nr:DUF6338 family protein [Plantibacter sp. ME-Dv--P-095]